MSSSKVKDSLKLNSSRPSSCPTGHRWVWGMPELVLGEGDDVIQLPEVDGDSANVSIGRRHAVGTELIVRRFTHTGDTVCDPLLMSGASAALAALRSGRRFVGSCHDVRRFEYVRGHLMREDEGR